MKNQELAFRKSEGNKWFLRNLKKLEENSIEISLLCNWLMPFQNDINNILEIGSENCCDDSSCDNANLDLNNDNYIIDPNNDNYDSTSNPSGTENNGLLDWTDGNEDSVWSSYDAVSYTHLTLPTSDLV